MSTSTRTVSQLGSRVSEGVASRLTSTLALLGALRRVRRVQSLGGAVACAIVFVVYGQLLGGGPTPPPLPPPPPNAPPAIVNFVGIEGFTQWTFQGQVLDENPVGLVITFGGLLSGHQTAVQDSDGYFSYGIQLQTAGTATAHTVDDEGQGSNYATYVVH